MWRPGQFADGKTLSESKLSVSNNLRTFQTMAELIAFYGEEVAVTGTEKRRKNCSGIKEVRWGNAFESHGTHARGS